MYGFVCCSQKERTLDDFYMPLTAEPVASCFVLLPLPLSRRTLIESGYQFSPGDRCGSRRLIGKSKGAGVSSHWPTVFCLCAGGTVPSLPLFVSKVNKNSSLEN